MVEDHAGGREFEFDLYSVFGELGAAWGEGVLAEGGEFGVKVGFGGVCVCVCVLLKKRW